MALSRVALLLLVSLVACGRSALRGPGDQAPSSTPATAVACPDLKPLADRGPLLGQHTKAVYFTRDRSHVVLRVSAGILDRLVRIDFPSGNATILSSDSVYWAQALGPDGKLLVDYRANDGKDPLYVYDGTALRALAKGLGNLATSPDGQRVCAVAFDNDGTFIEVFDLASGTSSVLVRGAANQQPILSPSGNWLAYQTAGTSDATLGVVNLKSGGGYVLAGQAGARDPFFVTDDLLIFVVGQYPAGPCDLWGHHVGSGSGSYLISSGETIASPGYEISADRRYILTSRPDWSYLSRHSLDGQEHYLLSTLLFSSEETFSPTMRLYAFESQRPRAIYLTGDASPAVMVLLSEQGPPLRLADKANFLPAPSTSAVILFEDLPGGSQRLRLVGIDSQADQLSYTVAGSIGAVTSVRNDGALLFVERTATGQSRLRFLSAGQTDATVLGAWNTSAMETLHTPETRPRGSYPVDPTGCFTIVDSDLSPNVGTSLVLLP